MTTANPVVKLGACSRCNGTLALIYDVYGGYFSCISCGDHTEADVPVEARIARAEAMKAYHTFFEYAGPQKGFQGLRLRGRLLPRVRNYKTETFDLLCPYPGCQRHQKRHGSNARIYRCKNAHPVYLDLTEQTWR